MMSREVRPVRVARQGTGELAKALVINTVTDEQIPVMYNPEELKLDQGNTFAEVGIPGLNVSPVQYVRGRARTLAMDLFFDTYETGQDVRRFSGRIVQLMAALPQTKAPPILLFSMGQFHFECVLTDVEQRFTMFRRDGTPVRAILSVRFQEYVRVDVEIERGLFFGPPTLQRQVQRLGSALTGQSTVYTTRRGDTLSGLAAAYLGDPALWRDIAEVNDIDDPLALLPGRQLLIPARVAPRSETRSR